MAAIKRLTGAPSASGNGWKAIDWQAARREVRRLQIRIAKAVREGRHGRVKVLQWLLTHSFAGKALAVKRVVANRGSKTPGVDGAIWYTPKQRMRAVQSLRRYGYQARPLRRVYIPKKNGKMRPLSIPTMHDRAMQALYALALQPVAETTGDPRTPEGSALESGKIEIPQRGQGMIKGLHFPFYAEDGRNSHGWTGPKQGRSA